MSELPEGTDRSPSQNNVSRLTPGLEIRSKGDIQCQGTEDVRTRGTILLRLKVGITEPE
jgi:hypothetical protein